MDLVPHWRGRERYAVFDSAYGDGSAFGTLCDAWRADPQRPAHLHYVALADGLLPGFHRMPQADANITLDLLCAPLAQLSARIDAIHLRGGEAGTDLVRALAKLAVPGTILFAPRGYGEPVPTLQEPGFGRVGTGSSYPRGEAKDAPRFGRVGTGSPYPRGELQEALAAAGFVWHGDHAVFASRKPFAPSPPAPERRAIVVGAGLAGSAACERLCARGWQVTLVERHAQPAMEASGNLAGIFMPLLSKDDNIPTRLTRAAYLFALRYWDRIGGIGGAIEGAQCGVLQLARGAAHAEVQRAIAAATDGPKEFAEWLDSEAASALLGFATPDGGWLFRQGGWARPASVCAAMLAACGARLTQRFGAGSVQLERAGDQWRVLDAQGQPIAEAPTVILANGAGAADLAQSASLPLAAVRGQVTHLDAGAVPALPFVLCREAYLAPASHGIRSAGASYDLERDPALRATSQHENLEKIRSLLGDPAIGQDAPLRGRVGFRSVAPDRLPLVGALADDRPTGRAERLRDMPRHPGLHSLLGYASRGLIWAPLAAELLAAQLEHEPLPLETTLARALDPARFLLRGRRVGGDATKD